MSKPYYIYLLRCTDDSLYAGITTDVARRLPEQLSEFVQAEDELQAQRIIVPVDSE